MTREKHKFYRVPYVVRDDSMNALHSTRSVSKVFDPGGGLKLLNWSIVGIKSLSETEASSVTVFRLMLAEVARTVWLADVRAGRILLEQTSYNKRKKVIIFILCNIFGAICKQAGLHWHVSLISYVSRPLQCSSKIEDAEYQALV